MATRNQREREQVGQAAERLSGLVSEAVAATIRERSPEPARAVLAGLTSAEQREDERATELMVTLILVRWLSVAREQAGGDADERVAGVLAWVGDALGPRFAARARYTSGPLVGEDAAADIMQYRSALRGDFLPSLAWLLAGTVAVHGGGDIDWLRRLVGAAEPV